MHIGDEEAIRRLFTVEVPGRVAASDVPGYLRYLTEDVTWCPPNADDRYGHEQVAAGLAAMFAQWSFSPVFTVTDLEVFGDRGYVCGTGTIQVMPKDGSPPYVAHSRELWHARKEHHAWKLYLMIWNLKPTTQT